ncbi:MAG: hypothetical protein ACLRYU_02310 [Coprococcus sp.]
MAEKGTAMLVGALVNVATTAITAGVFGEEYTLKDAVMAAVTGAVGATGTAGPVAAALISGVTTFISSNKQGNDGKTSLMNAVMSGAFTLSSTGSIATFITSDTVAGVISRTVKTTVMRTGIDDVASAEIGLTCDLGSNLMGTGISKAYNGSVHASKKNKVNIQACAIASVIQIAVYKAKSMKKKQNNRRKKGWIDLEGIRKRRTYN